MRIAACSLVEVMKKIPSFVGKFSPSLAIP